MIVIIGDSWGVGEFGIDPITEDPCSLIGPGIGQLLMLHDQVINLSVSNGSNIDSLNRLEVFLSKYTLDNSDTIYWIITCPTRGINLNSLIDGPGNITTNIYAVLDQFFLKANQIAMQNNTHIKLIGGLCDLNNVDIGRYSNLEICVASWGLLLNDSYITSLLWEIDQLGPIVQLNRSELLSEWIDIADQVFNKHKTIKTLSPKYFNAWHPSRLGHRILRDYLYPDWHFKF